MKLPEQIDYVCPLGHGSKWDNNELRYSLRSLQEFGDVRNVWLIGERPEWFTGNHVRVADSNVATWNIWNKLLIACNTPEISDPFLYGNDDYFFIRPFVASEYPNYHGNLTGNNSYKEIVRHTMRRLAENDLPTLFYDMHRPMIIHKQKFIEAYNFFEFWIKINSGVVVKSCYGNLHQIPAIHCEDIKYAYWNGPQDVEIFSIGDDVTYDTKFRWWCMERWPEKSKWEK